MLLLSHQCQPACLAQEREKRNLLGLGQEQLELDTDDVHVPELSDIVVTGLEVGPSTEVSAVLALSGIAVRARAPGQEQGLG
jgi:hypothetical protein